MIGMIKQWILWAIQLILGGLDFFGARHFWVSCG